MRKRNDPNAPFQSVPNACSITGLSQKWLRAGCKSGDVPHIKVGNTYYVNVPALLRKLEVTV